jgi:hypothetical protein
MSIVWVKEIRNTDRRWYLTCRKFQLCFAYNETLGCLPDFINFNKNFLFIKYENNVVLHRLSVFLISFTQTIDINVIILVFPWQSSNFLIVTT